MIARDTLPKEYYIELRDEDSKKYLRRQKLMLDAKMRADVAIENLE